MLASMLLAQHTMLFGPSYLLGLLGNAGVQRLHLALSFMTFSLVSIRRLCIKFCIVLDIL